MRPQAPMFLNKSFSRVLSMPTFSLRRAAWLALLTSAIALAACNQPDAPPDQAKAAPPAKGKAASSQEAGEKENAEKESKEAGEAGLLRLSAEEIETAGIRVEDLKMKPVADQVVLTATIRANQDRIAHIAPRVSARVAKSIVNLGDSVKAGQALAVLDSLELGEAHSAYRQAQSQFALAKADFERAEKLKVDEIIPEKDYLRARSEYEKARAAWRAADDRLRLLDGEHRDSDQGPTSLFPLRAPFAGTVIEKRAVVGELAQPDKSLFTVADLSTLWIEANLFEKDLSRVRLGARAIVTVSAYPEETFQGRLTYISSTVDKETRAVPARVEVPNPDRRLKPEMFATAAIATGGATSALTLPQSAVLLVNGQPMAFVREEGGFEPRAVELGEKVGSRVIIRGGIKPSESMVVAGAYALKARLLKSQIGDAD